MLPKRTEASGEATGQTNPESKVFTRNSRLHAPRSQSTRSTGSPTEKSIFSLSADNSTVHAEDSSPVPKKKKVIPSSF